MWYLIIHNDIAGGGEFIEGTTIGGIRRLYFENFVLPPAAHLLHAGIAVPRRANNWWNTYGLFRNPYYSLSFVLEQGRGCYRDENGFTCQLSYGSVVIVNPRVSQHFGPGKGELWSDLLVSFNGTIFDALLQSQVIDVHCPVWLLEDPAPWARRLELLLTAARPITEKGIVNEALCFLTFLRELLENARPEAVKPTSSDWFTKACNMLTNDLSQKVDMQAVAQELGMSYHTFRSYFAKRAGMPPSQYRNRQRIEAACQFLKQTNKRCVDIAFHFGYSSEQRFSMDFKKFTGVSPTTYRKRHRAKVAPTA